MPPARIELARLRLEDVFVRIVAEAAARQRGRSAPCAQACRRQAPRRHSHDSPKKIALVASREFMAAVANKGFVIGLLIMPAMFAVLVAVMPRLMSTQSAPGSSGEVAVIDPDRARSRRRCAPRSTPEAIQRRRGETRARPAR